LDDSLGEEVAMLIAPMLAGASAVFILAGTPALQAQQGCAAQSSVLPVSRTPARPDVRNEGGKLPDAAPKTREPAVLLPHCKKGAPLKRRRRLSDYPMA
jgi:hypothetical protein